jgi:hypothetical protein
VTAYGATWPFATGLVKSAIHPLLPHFRMIQDGPASAQSRRSPLARHLLHMVFGVQALSRIVNFTNVEVSGYDSSSDEELDMRRRDFIAVVSGATVAMPISTRAQQPKITTVGVLVRDAPGWEQFWKMFPKALNDLGYVEGKNIRFEFRSDKGQQGRLPELVPRCGSPRMWFPSFSSCARRACNIRQFTQPGTSSEKAGRAFSPGPGTRSALCVASARWRVMAALSV